MHIVDRLVNEIQKKGNPVCVGIDPDIQKIPGKMKDAFFQQYGISPLGAAKVIYQFSKEIMDVVADKVPVVKFQMAYFEQFGYQGLKSLQMSVSHAHGKGLLVVLDGKRNDIGSTAKAYSSAYLGITTVGDHVINRCYETDFLTVNPYLGTDGIKPFLEDSNKFNRGMFVLAKTSNPSSGELQDKLVDGVPLYKQVVSIIKNLSSDNKGIHGYSRVGMVVGATYPGELANLREELPDTFFLLPGYGFQGAGINDIKCAFKKGSWGAIVNSSRNIIFAYMREDYKNSFTEDKYLQAVETAVNEMTKELSSQG